MFQFRSSPFCFYRFCVLYGLLFVSVFRASMSLTCALPASGSSCQASLFQMTSMSLILFRYNCCFRSLFVSWRVIRYNFKSALKITLANHNKLEWTNQIAKQRHASGAKRGNRRLLSLLIGAKFMTNHWNVVTWTQDFRLLTLKW